MRESLRYCNVCGASELEGDLKRCINCNLWACDDCWNRTTDDEIICLECEEYENNLSRPIGLG